MIKNKWKSIRDAYTRYMRLIRNTRSGSSACAPKEYIHAKELEFLRPSLTLASTENSWEEAAPTAPVGMDSCSINSADQALAGLEPESQLATSSQSTTATPVGEEESTPRPLPRVAARGIRRKAPDPDPNVKLMLEIMADMKERMGTNRSYGHMSAKCLGELMDRVPKRLQADMLAGTIRYIATFIPPEEPYQSPEPPPPYGPYATHPPQHMSAPPLPHFTAPPFPSHLPQPTPPYPTQTTTLSTHPHLPTPPSAYTTPTSTTVPDFTHLQTQTSTYPPQTTQTLSPYTHPQTTPSAYHPPTSQTLHLPTQPPTYYPSRTTSTYSDYPHLPTLPPYNPQPTPTPPPPPATPPSRWTHASTSSSKRSRFDQSIHAGMSVDDTGESPKSFQNL
ncbi:soluble scavenger receptor cysteine-rich domain-containing protein SSC5D-like [Rana temporaria]|uniref:soluble scavenger receptor cysteine-rich domain-containing protein SSC5D-like n=1 Tax=Rana temporaria TaxID=8407 RepID=UPI001AAD837D|nr:soluble scavenger receptor cysteine-rich domain-containing protein SSC5D-like [Rana temporaria]